jgi:hypothetical protein
VSFLNILAVSGPNEVDDVHKIRFTPEDSTAAYLEHLYKYDFLSPQLRRSKQHVTPNFIQKIAYTINDLNLILDRGKAERVTNIEFLYFTGHAGEGKFGFFKTKKVNGEVGPVWITAKNVIDRLLLPDVNNIIVSGCDYLPSDTDSSQTFLTENLGSWDGKLFLGLSAPPDMGPLWNRDILSLLSTIFCVIFDKYVYKESSKINQNTGDLIREKLCTVYSEGYLKRCGVCMIWKPDKARQFQYWDYSEYGNSPTK